MRVFFTKMHGLGNDFVVIDARSQPLDISAALARHLADRRRGIGCDQVLLVSRPGEGSAADIVYRIFNASGGEVQQCGNGARALALFVRAEGAEDRILRMESPAGLVEARFHDDGEVSVNMGAPQFAPAALPFAAPAQASHYEREVDGETIRFGAVSMGNPHIVIPVDDVAGAPVDRIGPLMQTHADFPDGVNVGFVQVLDRSEVRLRVWERGVGETLACGTGACAAAAVCFDQGLTSRTVRLHLPGGELMVDLAPDDSGAWLKGAAAIAFEGNIVI